eukprot:COSAG06_NODE_5084_length_3736_cov_1.812483_2_plen_391_part_00
MAVYSPKPDRLGESGQHRTHLVTVSGPDRLGDSHQWQGYRGVASDPTGEMPTRNRVSPDKRERLSGMLDRAAWERSAEFRRSVQGWTPQLEQAASLALLEQQLAGNIERRTGNNSNGGGARRRPGKKKALASVLERSRPSAQQRLAHGGNGGRGRTTGADALYSVKSVGDLSLGSASEWQPSGNSRSSTYVTNPAASPQTPPRTTRGLELGQSMSDLYTAGVDHTRPTASPVFGSGGRASFGQRRARGAATKALKPGQACLARAKSKGWLVPAVILELETGDTVAHVGTNLTLGGREKVQVKNSAEFRVSDKPLTHQTRVVYQQWQAEKAAAAAAKRHAALVATQRFNVKQEEPAALVERDERFPEHTYAAQRPARQATSHIVSMASCWQ